MLVTGRGEVKDRLTGLQVGADDYLVKPFNRDEVVKRVARAARARDSAAAAGTSEAARSRLESDAARPRHRPAHACRSSSTASKKMLIEQSEIGIVFVDIEQFESIEAEYGWAFFDELLRHVGEIISAEAKDAFRERASSPAHRVGGSSFYVFYETRGQDLAEENASERDRATSCAQKLIDSTRERFPNMQPEQIGFFVGAARIDYRPQIRLERQIYAGHADRRATPCATPSSSARSSSRASCATSSAASA